jgi:excisionase family DNA binding protein
MPIPSTGLGGLDGALVVKPRAACRLLNCSHKRLYQLLAEGELQSFRDGGSRKIVVESIRQFIARRLVASENKLKCPAKTRSEDKPKGPAKTRDQ